MEQFLSMRFVEKMTSNQVICVRLAIFLVLAATVPFTTARSVLQNVLA